jgi:predicted RNase H-like nuclease (RuvC/YqgF family)
MEHTQHFNSKTEGEDFQHNLPSKEKINWLEIARPKQYVFKPETEAEIFYFNKLQMAVIEINQLKKEMFQDKAEIYDLQSSVEGKKVLIKRLEKQIKTIEKEAKLYKDMSIDGKVKLTAREEIMTLKKKLTERDQMISELLKRVGGF